VSTSFPAATTHKVLTFSHLLPGGFLQVAEFSAHINTQKGSLPENSALARWGALFSEIGQKAGRTFQAGEKAHEFMAAAGFKNIETRIFKVPIGGWAEDEKLRDCGYWHLAYLYEGLEGFFLRGLTGILEVSPFTVTHEAVLTKVYDIVAGRPRASVPIRAAPGVKKNLRVLKLIWNCESAITRNRRKYLPGNRHVTWGQKDVAATG
jgi:hypothetical protein